MKDLPLDLALLVESSRDFQSVKDNTVNIPLEEHSELLTTSGLWDIKYSVMPDQFYQDSLESRTVLLTIPDYFYGSSCRC